MRPALIAVLVVTSSACATTGSQPAGEAPPASRAFLDGLQRAVAGHRWAEVVDHFAPSYVAAQRDEMLAGRTGQFLVEAFGLASACPGYAGDESRSLACLDRVCSFRVRTMLEEPGEALPTRVRMEVEPRCGAAAVVGELVLVPGPSQGGKRLALEGPVG